jgi:hypothetical protein
VSGGRRAASAVLAGLLLVAAGCSKDKGSGPSAQKDAYLLQHNARFNDGRTIRWAALPIRVFANGIALPGEVTEWTSATGGRVTFAFVDSRQSNGINFGFRGGTDICGVTTVEYRSNGEIIRADVLVSQSIYRSAVCVRTVTHETGHGVGFLDHTDDGGLMDDDGGNGSITAPVGQMLQRLYELAPGTLVAAQVPGLALRRGSGRHTLTFVYPARR